MLRSSVQTIACYHTATDHLLRFLEDRPARHAAQFTAGHAEQFVRNERDIPLVPALADVLRAQLCGRTSGPAFRRRRYAAADAHGIGAAGAVGAVGLEVELARRL